MILKILRSGILILMVANLVSCATIFHGNKNVKMIPISGTPSGAKVYLGNKELGTTPFNYTPPETQKQELKIVKDGYKDHIATIETKLNPLWTGVSIVGGALGLFIPTIIDFSKGSVKDIKTDRIEYTLDSVFKGVTKTGTAVVATVPFSRSSSEKKIVVSSDSVIYNPALRVRTYSRELTLSFRSAVSVKTKNEKMIRTNIKKVDTEGVTLAKNNTKIYYSDFKKVRIYHARRWFPWLTLPTIIGPIWWHASSKVIESDARKCKRQVVDLRVINHFNKYQFGKVNCYNRGQ